MYEIGGRKTSLQAGTVIIDGEDFKKNFDIYMDEWGIDEGKTPEYKLMLDSKKPVEGWGIVEKEDETWYIMYVL